MSQIDFFVISIYPNPFNNSTKLSFTLLDPGHVTFAVYNVLGKKVKDITETWYKAGTFEKRINTDNWSSGMYMVVLKKGNAVLTSTKYCLFSNFFNSGMV